MAGFQFDNITGLLALLSIVPLIILYLIRPRPKLMTIPSLMFFMQTSGSNRLTSFLKNFVRDLLFLMQLLTLLILSTAVAKPYTNYQYDITAKNTVIVLDVSASMQTIENGRTRLEIAIDKAKDVLGGKNSIVLAKEVPFAALRDADYSDANEFLKALKPKATPSRIGDAIILAGELLSGEGRVVVISDFINTGGQDPETAKGVLTSKGLVVDFIDVTSEERSNVGFVGVKPEKEQVTTYIKNFDRITRTIQLTAGETKKVLELPPGYAENFVFKPQEGITKVTIEPKDDFPLDNELFVSAPTRKKVNALLITNQESVFIKNALIASGDVEVTVAEPPVVPKTGFDVYVVHNVDMDKVLPGTFEDIAGKVKEGASVVVHAQERSDTINYQGLSPVKIGPPGDRTTLFVEHVNQFTKNIDFGGVEFYYTAELEDGITLVSAEQDPVVAISTLGRGKRMYYGIVEKASEFKFSPEYPIFWTELMYYLTGQQNIKNLNYKTSDTLILDRESEVQTPTKTVKQSEIILEEQGIYTLPDRQVAVNLADEMESSINSNISIGVKSTEFELKPVTEKRKFLFERAFLWAAMALLLIETIYIKKRGDV